MKDTFEGYIRHYRRMGNAPLNYGDVTENPARFRFSEPWLPSNRDAPILDVGCGWGNLLMALWASGFRNLSGIEVSRDQHEVARKSLPREVRLLCADAKESLRDTAERYRLVLLFDVIEHMTKEDGLELLGTIWHVLERGGSLVIRTPNMANLCATYTRYMDITHVTGYTEWSLFQLLEMAGYSDARIVRGERDLRFWRWYAPWRGFGVRERIIDGVHGALYWLMGLRPRPTACGFNLVAQGFKGDGS